MTTSQSLLVKKLSELGQQHAEDEDVKVANWVEFQHHDADA